MKKLVVISILIALVGCVFVGSAQGYRLHGKHCASGFVKKRKTIKRHHHRKRIWVCVRETKAGSPLQPKKRTLLAAKLDQIQRHPANPFEVTYTYGGSATEEESIEGQAPSFAATAMPTGVISLYSDGFLECAQNVGGVLEAANNCDVTYEELGKHKITTIYTSGSESSAVNEVVNIEPYPTTTSITTNYIGFGSPNQVEGSSWYQIGVLEVSYSATPSVPQVNNALALSCGEEGLIKDEGAGAYSSGCINLEPGGGKYGVYEWPGGCNDGKRNDGPVIITAVKPDGSNDFQFPQYTQQGIESGAFHIRASVNTTYFTNGYASSEEKAVVKFSTRWACTPSP